MYVPEPPSGPSGGRLGRPWGSQRAYNGSPGPPKLANQKSSAKCSTETSPSRVRAPLAQSIHAASCHLWHRRTMSRDCRLTSPSWLRRPIGWTKVPYQRQRTELMPSSTSETQVLRGPRMEDADGDLGSRRPGRVVRASGVYRADRHGYLSSTRGRYGHRIVAHRTASCSRRLPRDRLPSDFLIQCRDAVSATTVTQRLVCVGSRYQLNVLLVSSHRSRAYTRSLRRHHHTAIRVPIEQAFGSYSGAQQSG